MDMLYSRFVATDFFCIIINATVKPPETQCTIDFLEMFCLFRSFMNRSNYFPLPHPLLECPQTLDQIIELTSNTKIYVCNVPFRNFLCLGSTI